MREIGAFAAKTHLSHLLDQVRHGETFAITKHGQVIAFLVPAEAKPKLDFDEAIAGIMALRKKITKRGAKLTLKDIQKFKETGRK
ncbi:MAG: type II toxin-antitoxin system prevent-host-death family antitoxin [Gammaproteobacteria bacterium]|nr:MAG: type II toxin-antitoxin system prevent-host-death family antitoxin [Gammaproteobacteria bacterium]